MDCSTTCPRRWTLAGSRGGRWVALLRATSCPAFTVCAGWLGSAGSSWVPFTTRTSTPLGSVRSTVIPPRLSGSFVTFGAGRVGEPQDVGGFGGPERGAQVRRPRTPAHDHTGCAAVGPAQLQLVRRPAHGGETERVGKSLGAGQVRLLELQPGQVLDLDRRVGRPAGVLPAERSLFAVQVAVSPVMGGHRLFLSILIDEIITYDCIVSQDLMRNSSVLTGARYDDRTYPNDAAQ